MTEIDAVWTTVPNATYQINSETTSPRVIPELMSLADHCANFRFYFNFVIIGLLCIIGLVGNTLSLVVLQRDKTNKVPVFLLQTLAVADNLVLLVSSVVLCVLYGLMPVVNAEKLKTWIPYIVKYVNPLGYMTQCFAVWITVLLAVNRYIAICMPFRAYYLLTMTKALIQVSVVAVLSFAFNLPRVFQMDIVSVERQNRTIQVQRPSELGQNELFTIVYINAFYTAIVLILPLILLLILNSRLIMELRKIKTKMTNNSLQYNSGLEDSITIVMVVIILELLVCHLPDRIVQVLSFIYPATHVHCPNKLFYIHNVSNLLIITNSSSNFFIYCVLRKSFRDSLCRRRTDEDRLKLSVNPSEFLLIDR